MQTTVPTTFDRGGPMSRPRSPGGTPSESRVTLARVGTSVARRSVLVVDGDRRTRGLTIERLGNTSTIVEVEDTVNALKVLAAPGRRDYVARLRLNRATELMLGSTLSLTAVAVEAGFYDLPHFDKVFRHRFRMSPQQFRVQQVGAADAGVHGRRGRRH